MYQFSVGKLKTLTGFSNYLPKNMALLVQNSGEKNVKIRFNYLRRKKGAKGLSGLSLSGFNQNKNSI